MKKMVQLVSGNFSEKGNFSGYDVVGERYFIHQRQMNALGFTKDDDLTGKFPLFVVAVEREFNVMDENNEPTNDKFKRVQAGSTFTDKATLINAYNSDKLLEIEATKQLKEIAVEAGLSAEVFAVLTAGGTGAI